MGSLTGIKSLGLGFEPAGRCRAGCRAGRMASGVTSSGRSSVPNQGEEPGFVRPDEQRGAARRQGFRSPAGICFKSGPLLRLKHQEFEMARKRTKTVEIDAEEKAKESAVASADAMNHLTGLLEKLRQQQPATSAGASAVTSTCSLARRSRGEGKSLR